MDYNVQVSPLRKTIGTGGFHQAIDHSTGPGSFYRVAEQPVLASHSKGTDGVLSKVIGNLDCNRYQNECCLRAYCTAFFRFPARGCCSIS